MINPALYYKNKQALVLQGDSRTAMNFIPANSVDLIFTSPPYNTGKGEMYDVHVDKMGYNEYIDLLLDVFLECSNKLKVGGHLVINMPFGIGGTEYQPYAITFIEKMRLLRIDNIHQLVFRGIKLWLKGHTAGRSIAVGSMYNKPSVNDDTELVIFFRKGLDDRNGLKGSPPTSKFKKDMGSTWYYPLTDKDLPQNYKIRPATSEKDRFGHGAVMPLALAHTIVEYFTREGEVVFDPFAGIGTTLLAANRLRRIAWGIELSADYCEIIKKRIAKYPILLDRYLVKGEKKTEIV